ncbi:hypothetical protein CUZ56_01991 [Saezia sanguinis]|uniref:Proteinase inhibitor I42 chagasin domain-containing protein n=1 Tax=Saezia sanguinis TaxID=1965230 RepID=A0A433SC45_9BURK|nr:protease inhibitor I42 family protein [Saezia sanguinis]RUS66266.1 hypothetical protein CUZ56_01991 [Saezia sanguinis]
MKKNVGEVFTVERVEQAGTGYSYHLVKLDGGLSLIDMDVVSQSSLSGGPVKRVFSFAGMKPGKAVFQLAKFRVFDLSNALYEEEMTVEIQPAAGSANNANMVGGWSEQKPLTKEDKAVFDEALTGFVGVQYVPVSVATQIVAGMNYRFICDAKIVIPNAQPYKAMVEIHKPLQGKAMITNIHRLP